MYFLFIMSFRDRNKVVHFFWSFHIFLKFSLIWKDVFFYPSKKYSMDFIFIISINFNLNPFVKTQIVFRKNNNKLTLDTV